MYVSFEIAQDILAEFKKDLEGYSTVEYFINDFEKVILIEDSLALYCSIVENEILQEEKERFSIYIEELTYNILGWKFDRTKFRKKIKREFEIFHSLGIKYKRFRGYKRLYWCPEQETLCEAIEKILPELKIRERYEIWGGIKYYFIVLEISDIDGITHYGVAYTIQEPHKFISSKCTYSLNHLKRGFYFGEIRCRYRELEDAFQSWKGISRQERLEKHFHYFYLEKYFREKDDVWRYADKILDRAYNNEFKDEERSTYTRPVNKWKSEELVYNMTKKLYKQYKVIYQHRPFFLRNPQGGQMTYDVYISELKVAIEYQGKQHFEPVDFFGGVEGYEKTIERDKIKQVLSKENGIKLVYINYWEEITPQLIKEKIEKSL